MGVKETTASSNWLDLSNIRQLSLRRIELNMFYLDCMLGTHINEARSHPDMCVVVGVQRALQPPVQSLSSFFYFCTDYLIELVLNNVLYATFLPF